MTDKIKFTKSSGNLFKDVGYSDEEARRLQFRSFLMAALKKYIQSENLTQTEAAYRLGVSQSRISNLTHSRMDLFSSEMLLDMLERVGFKIYERIELDITEAMNQPFLNFPKRSSDKTA